MDVGSVQKFQNLWYDDDDDDDYDDDDIDLVDVLMVNTQSECFDILLV